MPEKKDPSITFLNTFGYNVVKLPRAGIEPMDVIGRDETTQWIGPLSAVWSLRGATPSGAIAFGAGTTPAGAVIADTASPILLGSGCRIRI